MTCTPKDVRGLTGSTLSDSKIEPFIADANCIIDMAEECVDVTDACLVRACANLAAHYLVTSAVGKKSRNIKRQRIEDVYEVTYMSGADNGIGVLSTEFGAKANALMQGSLTEFDKPQASMHTIGTT